MEQTKREAAVKKLEKEMKEEKQTEATQRREAIKQRREAMEEKKRIEEAKALVSPTLPSYSAHLTFFNSSRWEPARQLAYGGKLVERKRSTTNFTFLALFRQRRIYVIGLRTTEYPNVDYAPCITAQLLYP